jgi:hypothetical protein
MAKKTEDTGRETILIPVDTENPEAAFTCGVNGLAYVIRRGEPVEVPREVAELVRDWTKGNEELLRARIKGDRETREKMQGLQ